MFDSLSDRLNDTFDRLRGKGKLSEADVKEAMREVRLALLEADVNYGVAKKFVADVTQKCIGAGVLESSRKTSLTYAKHLFDQSTVHKIEITMDGWDDFIDNCTDEKYRACAVTIDGEAQGTVGIRAQGNTSLSSMAQYDNDRYSFKIEFDHYQKKKTYRGLDKLSLNNIIQDATYMKDYWSYTFMNQMGLASPLCSYTEIYVNGEYWGLYLAVEGVEEAFLERNYGEDYGELYKPDSLSLSLIHI